MTESKLQSLISLLDDPDENIAVTVMGELLKNEAELMPLLGELQEADNKLLRKRVQQLETIIMLRNRRRNFLSRIDGGECDIADGLVELHLLYFDRDTPEMIRSLIELFVNVALNNNISSVDELGAFMAQNNFVLPMPDEKLEPENYCVGPILEDRIGSDILLCTLALLAGVHSGLPLELARIDGNFAVCTPEGRFISPANSWQADVIGTQTADLSWNSPSAVLKYASLMLFLHAVSSDNFRYVYTIAQAMSGGKDDFTTGFLPYPYNGKEPAE